MIDAETRACYSVS